LASGLWAEIEGTGRPVVLEFTTGLDILLKKEKEKKKEKVKEKEKEKEKKRKRQKGNDVKLNGSYAK
jgi:hypothetical protein